MSIVERHLDRRHRIHAPSNSYGRRWKMTFHAADGRRCPAMSLTTALSRSALLKLTRPRYLSVNTAMSEASA